MFAPRDYKKVRVDDIHLDYLPHYVAHPRHATHHWNILKMPTITETFDMSRVRPDGATHVPSLATAATLLFVPVVALADAVLFAVWAWPTLVANAVRSVEGAFVTRRSVVHVQAVTFATRACSSEEPK